MSKTITEKILGGKAGELIDRKIDLIMCHDVTTPPALKMLKKKGIKKVWDADKIVVTPDHFVPNKDIKSAELAKELNDWVKEQGIKHYYKLGCHGICHAILPEQGHIKPGMVVVGADSHTCTYGALGCFSTGIGSTDCAFVLATGKLWFKVPETIRFNITGKLKPETTAKDVILFIIKNVGVDGAQYKAMEFGGEAIERMSDDEKLTICNMAIEAGAKNGIIETEEYFSDKDCVYEKIYNFDISDLEPMVAYPHLPSNGKPISEAEKDNIKIDQAFIGSCTNGRFSDLKQAADILKGKKVKCRTIVIPATTDIYKKCLREGLIEIFINAGCVFSTPTCGPCLGGHMGVLAKHEKCVSTTNRNFVGRMGHPESEVYLTSPIITAASALKGRIVDFKY
ncbi:MAG: 3-isopropylmalate dehydratase large subunit [Patescibacteria group bacterium]|nr:3-isopropylmalate dehydratase large subunit [Patescibacteria group bacterium]